MSEPTEQTDDRARQERLRRNTNADPRGKSHEDEENPMHSDSWSGGSIVPHAKKVARGEAPADQPSGPSVPAPTPPATPASVTRPWSPEPTQANTTGSTEGVDYGGRPRGEEKDEQDATIEARQAPPTIRSTGDKDDSDRPDLAKGG